MAGEFWFNRMLEYWSVPLKVDVVDLVRRGRVQMVQIGTYCPQFYALADDPDIQERHWAGMPLVGVRKNLALAASLIPRLQEAGARVVGQMSLSWHYGDHETGKGLFGVWDDIWTPDLLGPAPFADPQIAQERLPDGTIRAWPIGGRPYRAYSGCISNPYWIATLKPMIRKAIALGLDGLMVHHNFSVFCHCVYCQEYLRPALGEKLSDADLRALFGTTDLASVADVRSTPPSGPDEAKQRFAFAINQLVHLRRKEVFDELYIQYGRSLKPDLMVSQWYHKYNFKVHDERSLLPSDLWAKDEDYIWYSQGGSKGISVIKHGYVTDMGLPARFVHAATDGRPFVINKYDYRRFRLSIAEAGANHAAGPAFHWTPQAEPGYDLADYTAPLTRYHRFLADHERLIHPAKPWSQIGLVYPRRAEVVSETEATEPLKRLGSVMENAQIPFDILIDEQLLTRATQYHTLILPNIRRMTREEVTLVRQFVEDGGRLVLVGENATLRADGLPYDAGLFAEWETEPETQNGTTTVVIGKGTVLFLPDGPWEPEPKEIKPGLTVPVYPLPSDDSFGKAFLYDLNVLCGNFWVHTDAPWFVRMRAWRPELADALVLHWINYQQDEDSEIEIPQPIGPIEVSCVVPNGLEITQIEWRYPEMREPTLLSYEVKAGLVYFTVPGLIVYGLSVLHLRKN